MEPVEHLTIDIPENFVGTVIERLGPRKGEMVKMTTTAQAASAWSSAFPRRGLIGLRSEMLTETRGTIVMNSIFDGYIPYQGEIPQRPTGALISDRAGTTTAYALDGLQDRGVLFVRAGVEVYEGMVVGEHSRDNDLDVNVVREKKLTNMRASCADEAIRLVRLAPLISSRPSSSSPTTNSSRSPPNRSACARRSCRPTAAPGATLRLQQSGNAMNDKAARLGDYGAAARYPPIARSL